MVGISLDMSISLLSCPTGRHYFTALCNKYQGGGEGLVKICEFGKAVKKRLIDMEQSQAWLIEQVKEKTGLYFDSSYMHRILTGAAKSQKIVRAICEVLSIEG